MAGLEAPERVTLGAWPNDKLRVPAVVGTAKNRLIHDNRNDLAAWTEKHNRYSTVEARRQSSERIRCRQIGLLRGLIHPPVGISRQRFVYARLPLTCRAVSNFLRIYIVNLGFLDGWPGLAHAGLWAFGFFLLTDAKMIELETGDGESARSRHPKCDPLQQVGPGGVEQSTSMLDEARV